MTENAVATEVVEGGRRNHYYVDSEVAFIQRFCEKRGIALSDFNRIHDEALTYLHSLKNGYGDCGAKMLPEFSEFLSSWDGAFTFSSEKVESSFKHISELKSDIENVLTSLDEAFLAKGMSTIMDDEVRDSNPTLWLETREYWNSTLNHYGIEVNVKDWFTKKLKGVTTELEFLTKIKDKTEAEMVELYYFDKESFDLVFGLFEAQKEKDLSNALLEIVPNLSTEKTVRAYISIVLSVMSAWISGLDLEHWFKVVSKVKEYREGNEAEETEEV